MRVLLQEVCVCPQGRCHMDRNMRACVASINCCWHCPLEMCDMALVLSVPAQTPALLAPENFTPTSSPAEKLTCSRDVLSLTIYEASHFVLFFLSLPSVPSLTSQCWRLINHQRALPRVLSLLRKHVEGLSRAESIGLTLRSANKYAVGGFVSVSQVPLHGCHSLFKVFIQRIKTNAESNSPNLMYKRSLKKPLYCNL